MMYKILLAICAIVFLGFGIEVFIFWWMNPEISQMKLFQDKFVSFCFISASAISANVVVGKMTA